MNEGETECGDMRPRSCDHVTSSRNIAVLTLRVEVVILSLSVVFQLSRSCRLSECSFANALAFIFGWKIMKH